MVLAEALSEMVAQLGVDGGYEDFHFYCMGMGERFEFCSILFGNYYFFRR